MSGKLRFAALLVVLVAPIVIRLRAPESCHFWAPGHGQMPLGAGLYVALNAIIAACYCAIPLWMWMAARGQGGYKTPRWLALPLEAGAAFVFACGADHVLRAITSPIVYCAEGLWMLAVVAGASIVSAVLISYTSQGIIASVAFFGTDPRLHPVLEARYPWQAVRALRDAYRA